MNLRSAVRSYAPVLLACSLGAVNPLSAQHTGNISPATGGGHYGGSYNPNWKQQEEAENAAMIRRLEEESAREAQQAEALEAARREEARQAERRQQQRVARLQREKEQKAAEKLKAERDKIERLQTRQQELLREKQSANLEAERLVSEALGDGGSGLELKSDRGSGKSESSRQEAAPTGYLEGSERAVLRELGVLPDRSSADSYVSSVSSASYNSSTPNVESNLTIDLTAGSSSASESSTDAEERESVNEQKEAWKKASNNIWKSGAKNPWGIFQQRLDEYEKDPNGATADKILNRPPSQSNKPVVLPGGTISTSAEQQKMEDQLWLHSIGSPSAK